MRTRRQLKDKKDERDTEILNKDTANDEETVDIDLEDPDVQAATEKIQAGYKGMRTRRDMKAKTEVNTGDNEIEETVECTILFECHKQMGSQNFASVTRWNQTSSTLSRGWN